MTTVLFRTVIIYILLIFAMRIMGKRQIGELEVSDLVTTFLLSEIASLPIANSDLPLSHAVIPILVLLSLEVAISMIISRFPKIKRILTSRPSTLIKNGFINQKAMKDARLSFDELFCELRRQGVDDISQLKYAILEQNGSITVIQKAKYKQPTLEQLHIKVKETGLFHIIIEEGCINDHGLDVLELSRNWVEGEVEKRGLEIKEVYLMLINDSEEIKIIPKERSKKK